MGLLIATLVLVSVAVAGYFFGADSRDGQDWKPLCIPGPQPREAQRIPDSC